MIPIQVPSLRFPRVISLSAILVDFAAEIPLNNNGSDEDPHGPWLYPGRPPVTMIPSPPPRWARGFRLGGSVCTPDIYDAATGTGGLVGLLASALKAQASDSDGVAGRGGPPRGSTRGPGGRGSCPCWARGLVLVWYRDAKQASARTRAPTHARANPRANPSARACAQTRARVHARARAPISGRAFHATIRVRRIRRPKA